MSELANNHFRSNLNNGYSNFSIGKFNSNDVGDSLSNETKKLEQDAKNEANKESESAKNEINKESETVKAGVDHEATKMKDLAKSGGLFTLFSNITSKFNPAAAIPRAAGLGLVRLNFLGIARVWHPALLTDAELKADNYDPVNAAKLKKLWNTDIKKFWEDLGGDISSLSKAVKGGYNKPIFGKKKVTATKKGEAKHSFTGNSPCDQVNAKLSPFDRFANQYDFSNTEAEQNIKGWDGYSNCGDGCVEALIGAGGTVVVSGITAIGKTAGAKPNPYIAGSPQAKAADQDPPPITPPDTPMDNATLKAIAEAALNDKKTKGLDKNTYEAEFNAIEKKYAPRFLGMPKALGITVTIIGSLGAIYGIFQLVKHLKK